MGRGEGGKVTADTAIEIAADVHDDRMAASTSNLHRNIGEQHTRIAFLGRGFASRRHHALPCTRP